MSILDFCHSYLPQHLFHLDPPGPVVLLAGAPPGQALGELLMLQGLGFDVVLAALGRGLLIIPDFPGRPTAARCPQAASGLNQDARRCGMPPGPGPGKDPEPHLTYKSIYLYCDLV